MAAKTALPDSTRLSRMRRFFESLQRPEAMLSPARWTMAVSPSIRLDQPVAVLPSH